MPCAVLQVQSCILNPYFTELFGGELREKIGKPRTSNTAGSPQGLPTQSGAAPAMVPSAMHSNLAGATQGKVKKASWGGKLPTKNEFGIEPQNDVTKEYL